VLVCGFGFGFGFGFALVVVLVVFVVLVVVVVRVVAWLDVRVLNTGGTELDVPLVFRSTIAPPPATARRAMIASRRAREVGPDFIAVCIGLQPWLH
jgi:uncharacterized MAPEG superfamily protein